MSSFSKDDLNEAINMLSASMPPEKASELAEKILQKQKAEAIAEYKKKYPQFVATVDTSKIEGAVLSQLKQYQNDTMLMALKSINQSESPTDNPSTALLKQLFAQVLAIQKQNGLQSTLSQNITTFICKDTNHNNIASYQSDFNIPIAFKIHKYSCVIQAQASKKEVEATSFINPANYGTSDTTKELKAELEEADEIIEGQKKKLIILEDDFKQKIKQLEEQKEKIIQVVTSDGKSLLGERITERAHQQLPEILQALTTTNAMGFPEQLYIYGAPGAGKTHLARQIAKALGVRCFAYPMGPTITEGKLLGFNNIATGTFVPGWLYEAYKNGGLVALDEADLADASVLGAANSIDNDQFIFGNGELVNRHKQFYLIAFANTLGTGSTKGFIRNTLDAATRDRFTVIELTYDEVLEQKIYGNEAWARYVQKVRDYVKNHCQSSIYITPRATRKGAAYLAAGVSIDKVMDWCIFKGCSQDIRTNIIENVGNFEPNKLTVKCNEDEPQVISTKHSAVTNDYVITWPGFQEDLVKFSQNHLTLKSETKIADIKELRNWFNGGTKVNMSLGYAKCAIENWQDYYHACYNANGLLTNAYGYNIYAK